MSEQDKTLCILTEPGGVTVECAAADPAAPEKLPTFKMLCYTGGAMRVEGWKHPVVVDLAGMNIPSQSIPTRMHHEREQGVGHTTAVSVANGQLSASGVVSRNTPSARDVVDSAKNGFPWQCSIGASSEQVEYVEASAQASANNRTFDGPIYVVRKSTLGEISFVDRGADGNTTATVAASAPSNSLGKENAMADEQKPGAAPVRAFATLEAEAAEQTRLKSIEDLAVKYMREAPGSMEDIRKIAAAAAEDKTITQQQVELQLLRATRASAPEEFFTFTKKSRINAKAIEAAMAISSKLPNIEKHYSADVLAHANDVSPRGMSIVEALIMAAEQRGVRVPSLRGNGDIRTALTAAFPSDVQAGASTFSLSGILSNLQNKYLLESFNAVEQSWRQIASIKPVRDFKAATSYRMTGAMEFEEVGPDGELKHATVSNDTFTNQAKTHGKMFAITRQDIINDDLSAFSRIGQRLGRGGALKLNLVFWTEFMDNSAFFSSAHANYATSTTLAAAGLKTGVTLFRKVTDPDGKPKGIAPKILLVPVDLQIDAMELVTSTNFNAGGSSSTAQIPQRNVYSSMGLVPVASEYLSNTAITGYSAKAWYLLADPRDLPVIEVAFLNGQETPVVESADADFDTLGVQFRGYFDFGVAKQEWRGGVKLVGS